MLAADFGTMPVAGSLSLVIIIPLLPPLMPVVKNRYWHLLMIIRDDDFDALMAMSQQD